LEFRCLAPRQTKLQLEVQIARGKLDTAARLLFCSLEDGAVSGLTERTWAVGHTLVFLKRDGIEVISAALLRLRHRKAIRIEAAWRCIRQRRCFLNMRGAALRVEVAVRGFLARRRVTLLRRRRAATRLQRAERGRCVRVQWRRSLAAVKVIQAAQRARGHRERFLRGIGLLRRLQMWLRRSFRRQIAHRIWRSALAVQRIWRGHCGRRAALQTLAARHRLRLACRRLLVHWERKVCSRLIPPPRVRLSAGIVGESAAAALASLNEQALVSRLEDVGSGKLLAASAALKEKNAKATDELTAILLEHRRLSEQVLELERWTIGGIFLRLARSVCGEAE